MELKYFSSIIGVKMDENIMAMFQEYLKEVPIVSSDLDIVEDPSDVGGLSNVKTYYTFKNSGVEIAAKEEVVTTIHLRVKKNCLKLCVEGKGEKNSNSTKEHILSLFGSPDKTGGGKDVGILGFIGEWFLYVKGKISMNITFSKELKVELVCLMADFDI